MTLIVTRRFVMTRFRCTFHFLFSPSASWGYFNVDHHGCILRGDLRVFSVGSVAFEGLIDNIPRWEGKKKNTFSFSIFSPKTEVKRKASDFFPSFSFLFRSFSWEKKFRSREKYRRTKENPLMMMMIVVQFSPFHPRCPSKSFLFHSTLSRDKMTE